MTKPLKIGDRVRCKHYKNQEGVVVTHIPNFYEVKFDKPYRKILDDVGWYEDIKATTGFDKDFILIEEKDNEKFPNT